MPSEDETVTTETPRPIAVFLCERVLRDALRPDAISAVNIHNQMTVQTFPALVPLVFAFAMVTGSHTEFNYQFKFLNKQRQLIAASNVQNVAPLPNTNYTHTLIGAFQGLAFHEEGTYHLILSLNGEDVGSLGFQVIHFVPEPVSA